MFPRSKGRLASSPLLLGLKYGKGQLLTRAGLRGHFSGATALRKSVADAVSYIRQVVADYVTYGAEGDAELLKGKDILEIGPGDNLGTALLLLARGARTVTCIDGFAPNHNQTHNSRVYAALFQSLSGEEQERLRDVLKLLPDGSATLTGDRLRSRYSTPVDAAATPLEAKHYDIVLSRAVLEHLGDLETGWTNMAGCLRPGGEMWHKVDFRCHTMFEGIHPLYFLTVPDFLWNLISRPDPTLNRLRLPTYRDLARRDFSDSRFHITHIAGESEFTPHPERLAAGTHYGERHVESIRRLRPSLVEPFSGYSDEDLLVTGIFLRTRGLRS